MLRGNESTRELQLELCLCVFMCRITLDCQAAIVKTKDVTAVLFVRYLSCSIDQRQSLSVSLKKKAFFCLYAFLR